ncbi:MAG: DNA adenine methylase [Candidatus Bathyarchaeota archaeon]
MADPILKWAGGKRQLIPNILAQFPRDYKQRAFHEPFFGGGAVFFKIKPKQGSINDVNPRLMSFYRVVRDNPDELIELAKTYRHDKDEFYRLRERFNEPGLSDIEDASLLLYLNKTAFNGLYRVNSKGKFNVPFGRYKNPTIVDEKRISEASQILKNIEVLCTDFTYVIDYSKEGDLCYFDPPYLPVSDTADFTSYSKDGFSFDDQIRLRDTCVSLDDKGVLFVLSNSYVETLVDKYREVDSFSVDIVKANRAINSVADKRGPVDEILVTNINKFSLDAFLKH